MHTHNVQATNKTFELRRSQALDGKRKTMQSSDYNRMFLKLAQGG
jgi:hypothetical protein